MKFKVNERFSAISAIVIGILVAIIIAPKNEFLLPNFLYFWLPQGIIIGLLYATKMRPSVITGSAIIMTLHLIGYAIWVSSPSDAMAWIGYFFSIAGALVGAFIVGIILKKYPVQSSTLAVLGAYIGALIGIAIIQIGLCCTVLYCGFKC